MINDIDRLTTQLDMCKDIDRLTVRMERLVEAYRRWREGQALANGNYDYDLDESNSRLSEIVDVYAELKMAEREWVALMPDELRHNLKEQAEQRFYSRVEFLLDMGVLDDVLPHMPPAVQETVKAYIDGQ